MTDNTAEAVIGNGALAEDERFALHLPPDPASIRTARLFSAAVARHFGVGEDGVEDLKVAISEACTNAVKAHVAAGIEDSVSVRASASASGVVFEVIDAGPGFPPEPIPESATPPQGIFEGSLGLTLIRSLFPEVQIVHNDGRGMTVRFACTVSPDAEQDTYG